MTGYYDDPELQLCDHLFPCAVCDNEQPVTTPMPGCPKGEPFMARIHEGHCKTCGGCLVSTIGGLVKECITCESKAMLARIEAAMAATDYCPKGDAR